MCPFGYCDQSLQLVSVCFVCFDVGWRRVCFTAFVELVLSFDLSSVCWCTPRFPASAGSLLVIVCIVRWMFWKWSDACCFPEDIALE